MLLMAVLIFDADPNSVVYKDYTNNIFVPNFSHHKLTVFEYADGTNNVSIDDASQTFSATRTDLICIMRSWSSLWTIILSCY